MGYPAVATLTEALNVAQAIQEPTLTQDNKRKEGNGWRLSILQTDAAIHAEIPEAAVQRGRRGNWNQYFRHARSGGGMAPGMNFAIPISIAKQFLNEINVTPSESEFTGSSERQNHCLTLKIRRGRYTAHPQ